MGDLDNLQIPNSILNIDFNNYDFISIDNSLKGELTFKKIESLIIKDSVLFGIDSKQLENSKKTMETEGRIPAPRTNHAYVRSVTFPYMELIRTDEVSQEGLPTMIVSHTFRLKDIGYIKTTDNQDNLTILLELCNCNMKLYINTIGIPKTKHN